MKLECAPTAPYPAQIENCPSHEPRGAGGWLWAKHVHCQEHALQQRLADTSAGVSGCGDERREVMASCSSICYNSEPGTGFGYTERSKEEKVALVCVCVLVFFF